MYTQSELRSLDDKAYRESYVEGHVRAMVAYQIRCIRERSGLSQKAFAGKIGKPQSVISRLEDTEHGKITIQTLLDLARRLDVALIVKLASFPEFLQAYGNLSEDSLAVEEFKVTRAELYSVTEPAADAPTMPMTVGTANIQVYPNKTTYFSGHTMHYTMAAERYGSSLVVTGVAVTPYLSVQGFSITGGKVA